MPFASTNRCWTPATGDIGGGGSGPGTGLLPVVQGAGRTQDDLGDHAIAARTGSIEASLMIDPLSSPAHGTRHVTISASWRSTARWRSRQAAAEGACGHR